MATEGPDRDRSMLADAVLGAVVTVLLAFVPLSPVLGGAVAGYLHGEKGGRVGALSGLVVALPPLVFLVAVLGAFSLESSFTVVLRLIGELPLLFTYLFVGSVLYGPVLGAVGGVMGAEVSPRRSTAEPAAAGHRYSRYTLSPTSTSSAAPAGNSTTVSARPRPQPSHDRRRATFVTSSSTSQTASMGNGTNSMCSPRVLTRENRKTSA